MNLPLRIGVLAGASAPGIESLLERPYLFQPVVVAGCAAPLTQANALETAQVPVVYDPPSIRMNPVRAFHHTSLCLMTSSGNPAKCSNSGEEVTRDDRYPKAHRRLGIDAGV